MRRTLLSVLLVAAIAAMLINIWHQIGYMPWGTRKFVESAYQVLTYARFLAIPAALFVLLWERGRPTKTLAWVALMLGLPFLGTVLFLFFGLNLRQDRKFKKKQARDADMVERYESQFAEHKGLDLYRELEKQQNQNLRLHRQLISRVTGATPTSAYAWEVFHDGETLFDRMLEDIRQAKHHVHLEYFHFEDDWLGYRVADALSDAVARGVEVRLIYDAVGSRGSRKGFWRKLEKKGVQVCPFFEVRFRHLANGVNYRNHRKIVVIDGETSYTGGFNVSKEYIEGLHDIEDLRPFWRDTHVRFKGAATNYLQMIFCFDWHFSTKEELSGRPYFPEHMPQEGKIAMQVASSGPDTPRNNIKYAYFNIITRAEHYCYLVTPYFTPDESVLVAIRTAALSGVDVRVMLPRRSDSRLVSWASNSYIQELLESRVRVFHYTRGMLHSKVVVADDVVTSIGTANMDSRSHDLNFEVNAMFYDEDFARQERMILERDMELYCTELTLDNWPPPPWHKRLLLGFARAFSPLL